MTSVTGASGLDIAIRGTGDTDEETLTELQRLGFSSEEELQRVVDDAKARWMPRVMFILMPIFGALVHRARRRSGRKYPQHLIFSLHVHAAWFGAFAVLGLAGDLLGSDAAGAVAGAAAILYAFVYVAVALRHVFGGTLRRAVAQAFVICGIYGVATILITTAIVVPAVLAGR